LQQPTKKKKQEKKESSVYHRQLTKAEIHEYHVLARTALQEAQDAKPKTGFKAVFQQQQESNLRWTRKARFLVFPFGDAVGFEASQWLNNNGGAYLKTPTEALKKMPVGTVVNVTIRKFEMPPKDGRLEPVKHQYRHKVNIDVDLVDEDGLVAGDGKKIGV
jgi:hypothetical protein